MENVKNMRSIQNFMQNDIIDIINTENHSNQNLTHSIILYKFVSNFVGNTFLARLTSHFNFQA